MAQGGCFAQQQTLLAYNIRSNAWQRVACASFFWGTRPSEVFRRQFDLIVACDVVYNGDIVWPLAKSLSELLCPRDSFDNTHNWEVVGRRMGHKWRKKSRPNAPPPQALLALPDRTDFGLKDRSNEPLPDYETLLEALEAVMPQPLRVDRIGSIPPGLAGTLSSHVDLLLLSAC